MAGVSDEDAFLDKALGTTTEPAEEPAPAAKAAPAPEAKGAPVDASEETEADAAGEDLEGGPGEARGDQDAAAAPAGALSTADEDFAFQWLARSGLPRSEINSLLEEKPKTALALARRFKENQDTIARSRREASAEQEPDDARPSTSAPPKTNGASPEELRRAAWLDLVRDEFGEEDAQALERMTEPEARQARDQGQAPDPSVLVAVVAARERLLLSGHEELRDQAEYQRVLAMADALRVADPALGAEDAIAEAAELRRGRRGKAEAATQDRKRALSASQPVTARTRSVPIALTRDQAEDKWLDAKLAGDQALAAEIHARYKLGN